MANSNFVVQNGLTVGPCIIFSGNGDIVTTGNLTSASASESFTSINNTPIGNSAPSTGAFTTLSASSTTTLVGTTVNGTLTATTVNAGTIGNTGATLTGTVSTATQNSITTMTGLTSIGTAGVTTTAAGNFTITGCLTVNGTTTTVNNTTVETTEYVTTVYASAVNAATIGNTGAAVVGSTLNVSGGASAGTLVATNFSTANAQITGGTVNFTTSGATTGNFGTVNATTLNNTSGNITNLGGTTAVYTNFSSGNIYSSGAHIPSANATVNLGGTSNYWNNFYAVSGTFNTVTVGAGSGILPAANVSVNIGSSSSWFNNIYGTAVHAQYADLAENYQADKFYNPGTVLMFGGSAEVTMADADTTRVAGVVSTNPATLMNGLLTGASVVPLALTGRVPCYVIGPVAKGDIMVSAGFGYAKVNNTPQIGTIIGKALEDFPMAAKGVIEVVVGRF